MQDKMKLKAIKLELNDLRVNRLLDVQNASQKPQTGSLALVT